jgi:hypothetical protein
MKKTRQIDVKPFCVWLGRSTYLLIDMHLMSKADVNKTAVDQHALTNVLRLRRHFRHFRFPDCQLPRGQLVDRKWVGPEEEKAGTELETADRSA